MCFNWSVHNNKIRDKLSSSLSVPAESINIRRHRYLLRFLFLLCLFLLRLLLFLLVMTIILISLVINVSAYLSSKQTAGCYSFNSRFRKSRSRKSRKILRSAAESSKNLIVTKSSKNLITAKPSMTLITSKSSKSSIVVKSFIIWVIIGVVLPLERSLRMQDNIEEVVYVFSAGLPSFWIGISIPPLLKFISIQAVLFDLPAFMVKLIDSITQVQNDDSTFMIEIAVSSRVDAVLAGDFVTEKALPCCGLIFAAHGAFDGTLSQVFCCVFW